MGYVIGIIFVTVFVVLGIIFVVFINETNDDQTNDDQTNDTKFSFSKRVDNSETGDKTSVSYRAIQ